MIPLPMAFVIGGTGESLSLIGPFFSAGRSYSIKVSAPTRSLFPSTSGDQTFGSGSTHEPGGEEAFGVESNSFPHKLH